MATRLAENIRSLFSGFSRRIGFQVVLIYIALIGASGLLFTYQNRVQLPG
jgi:hypothetical protein